MLQVENFKDYSLNSKNPHQGEIQTANSKVKAAMLAQGICMFEGESDDGNYDENILISAGVHPNEVEGQEALNQIADGIVNGTIDITRKRVMLIYGNIEGMQQGDKAGRSQGYNLNRLFTTYTGKISAKAKQSYEWERSREIVRIVERFLPTLHFDLHSTIKAPSLGPFAIHPLHMDKLLTKNRKAMVKALGVDNILINEWPKKGETQTTFTGWTAQDFDTTSYTVEMGRIGGSEAKAMINKVVSGLKTVLEAKRGTLGASINTNDMNVWEAVREIKKLSDDVQFSEDYNTFDPLEAGRVFAEQTGSNGPETYTANEGEYMVFPNTNVETGERICKIVRLRPEA